MKLKEQSMNRNLKNVLIAEFSTSSHDFVTRAKNFKREV